MKILTTLFIGLFLTFCSREETVLSRIQREGELRVLLPDTPSAVRDHVIGITGYEHDLCARFAQSLGVKLAIVKTASATQAIETVRRGEVHFAAGIKAIASIKAQLRLGPTYRRVNEQMVYRRGDKRPKSFADLRGSLVETAAISGIQDSLAQRIQQFPELTLRVRDNLPAVTLLREVSQADNVLVAADATDVLIAQVLIPELGVAFTVDRDRPLAWAFPTFSDDSLYIAAIRFLNSMRKQGELAYLEERHFGHLARTSAQESRRLLKLIVDRLPKFLADFKRTARKLNIDWRLLAAIGYQESHWDPDAVSPTGVRGLMMLTEGTAKSVGVKNRRDPVQSILGGAKYFLRVKKKIPQRIPEPDRTWLALAAYNVGFGHLEDARVLTERRGQNPDRWMNVRRQLPLLKDPKWHKTTRHGFARGDEPVKYVNNVRRYLEVLSYEFVDTPPLLVSESR